MRRGGFNEEVELSIGQKLLRFNWLLAALLAAAATVGFLMLYSVAGGTLEGRAERQIILFALGFGAMMLVAMIDIRFWRRLSVLFYIGALGMLVLTHFFGETGKGAQRWLDLRFMQIQPSEPMKIALVMALAAFYHWLEPERVSRPFWVAVALLIALVPAALVLQQPDLGTTMLLLAGAGVVMFLAGVSWWYFGGVFMLVGAGVWAVFASKGASWQILKDYQYRRIETFLDPSKDPLGAGYHITQSTIAIGSGGLDGKGLLRGSQTHLRFLPEAHTDFIFTTLAEEFGFRGGIGLLSLYMLIIFVATLTAIRIGNMFGRLLAGGVAATFFFFFAINVAMVTGLAPVVGVPLPLVSYGGTSMLTLMFAFGLLLSAQVHGDSAAER
ncbi:MAG: rod shape-determining protein RodA [Neomegalonema sp.]|nr:rod shape-determining protein RodA [Neomegalonema sp.]